MQYNNQHHILQIKNNPSNYRNPYHLYISINRSRVNNTRIFNGIYQIILISSPIKTLISTLPIDFNNSRVHSNYALNSTVHLSNLKSNVPILEICLPYSYNKTQTCPIAHHLLENYWALQLIMNKTIKIIQANRLYHQWIIIII